MFKGEKGVFYWRTIIIDGIMLRIVDYSEDFKADHWYEEVI